ncbi:MAG: bifunctional acetate--CoA ligase family protein/GNAT family N-acetyltransferase [Acuticoccus sp.]
MTVRNLDRMLAPRSVALIGASARPGSLGAVVLSRLAGAGFHGSIGLVNPKYDAIGERPCVARVGDLPFAPDLGVIVAPPAAVPGLVDDLGVAGARAAVVITAGLSRDMRQAMLDAARRYTLRILGPNCVGLQVPGIGLDASFAHLTAQRGNLALLSQSGAIVTAMLDWAQARGVGFSVVASMGDMADADVGDLLDCLAADRNTHAILMYVEGITEAKKFMSAARSAARAKPVIAIKAGRSASASRAAASHTGALAGADDVYEAAFARAGVLRVDNLQELFDAAEALARQRPLADDRLAILTNGGGAGVLAVDAVARTAGRLAELSPETLARLDAVLPPTWSRANPVDIIGDAGPDRYAVALAALLDAPEADAILVMNCPTGLASSAEAAEAVAATLTREGAKPVLASWLGGATATAAGKVLERAGVPVYAMPGQAVRAFDQLVRFRKAQAQLLRTPAAIAQTTPPDRAAAVAIVANAIAEDREILSEVEAKGVLRAYNIATVDTRVAATPDEAAAIAAEMTANHGERLFAVKILSRDISHKSDVGGVSLNLDGAEEVREAARSMLDRVGKAMPEARIEGVVVQPMVRRSGAHELLLGISDDATFGPVMLFGAGGTSVEVVADKALALPPLDTVLAADMIGRTRIARLLRGYRDKPAADLDGIVATLMRLSRLAADMPQIRELDINPLLADSAGVIALDARIRVAPAAAVAPGGNPRFAIRPYPAQWDRPADHAGGPLAIRPIRPEDEALAAAFLSRVANDAVKRRLFGTTGAIDHEGIARFTQIDYARAMVFVALDAAGAIVGGARLAAEPDGRRAEVGVLVADDHEGQGIARALMGRLIEYARAEGIGELSGAFDAASGATARIADAFGFAVEPAEDGTRRAVLRLDGAASG